MNTEPTDEQIDKLPKWAQRYIRTQQMYISNLNAHIDTLSQGPDDSDTFVEHYSTYPTRPLGKSPIIKFKLGDDTHENALNLRVHEHRDGSKYLNVMALSSFVSIRPRSGNTFDIYVEER
jgi:hypothetical protein